jgi:hypothetical protein
VDSFLKESALEKPKTLEKINELFQIWLSECYQNRPHTALKDQMSPEAAFMGDSHPLRFIFQVPGLKPSPLGERL